MAVLKNFSGQVLLKIENDTIKDFYGTTKYKINGNKVTDFYGRTLYVLETDKVKDFYGRVIVPMRAVNNKVIVATEEEVERNPRARSAKLRVAERVES